jgi:hypothetical protein
MGVGQPECGAASPAKWSNTNTGKTNKPKCRSSGCGFQFGGAGNDLLAISCKVQTHFLALPVRAIRGALCFGLKMRCASFYFERSWTAPSRCIEAPRAQLERALDPGCPGAPAEVLARQSWGRGRGVVASGRSYLCSIYRGGESSHCTHP